MATRWLCADGRRLWFFTLIFLLLLAMLVSVLMISSMQYRSTVRYSHDDELYYFTEANYTFCYALNISVIILCTVKFFILMFLWFVSEKWVWPKQRFALLRDRFEVGHYVTQQSHSFVSLNTTRHGAISTTSL